MPNARFLEADEIRLVYVAMTRTTEHLLLTYSRESPFVRRLIAAGAKPAA
jgi:superfamily I DNA/RNA helicase